MHETIDLAAVRLKRRRKARKLSLQKVADLSGVSYQYIHNIERGERAPHMDKLLRICDVLEYPLHELVKPEES